MAYDHATAAALLLMAFPTLSDGTADRPCELHEDGVFLSEDYTHLAPMLDWKPSYEVDDGQNPSTAPLLPIPFTAQQLAAAMLDGPLCVLQDAVGCRIGYDLPEDALDGLPPRLRWVRQALAEAYALAADAQARVGEPDLAAEKKANKLARDYEFGQGGEQVSAAQVSEARAIHAAAWAKWRKAMTHELLLALIDGKEQPAQETQPTPTPIEQPLNEAPTPAPTPIEQRPNHTATRTKRLTWLDVAGPYTADVMRAGQYATAKHLFKALEERAGPSSPFDKGTGDNRGSLFVRDTSKPLALKTVQNNFDKLREMVQKPAP